MKKIKAMIHILTIFIILVSMIGFFPKPVKAIQYAIDEADLYSKGEREDFSYKGVPVFVEFVVYKKNGVEYPAYCLNRNLPGVTEEEEYKVKVEKVIGNVSVWRAVTNGYPYKTASQLGCNSNAEAFAATKMAVYDALYTYDWNDFEKITEAGGRILKAAENISKNARTSNKKKPTAIFNVKQADKNWTLDKNNKKYVSKTYSVHPNATTKKYKVEIEGKEYDYILIQDVKGKNKKEFNISESFKVSIPISELDKEGKFKIKVTAGMETYPVLYGESPNPDTQDYALTAENIEYNDVILTEKFYKNDTKIKILKEDTDTGKRIAGAKFQILNEQKETVYSDLITNEKGEAMIENIMPGKYYVEEVQAPSGYQKYEGLIEINVAFDETYTVKVNNHEEEEKEIHETTEREITVKQKKLPRTGY